MMSRKHSMQGFTLVEILIVVVILGILAAIVIPQFTSASETAKNSSVLTQMQTIRSQLELYRVQHNDVYPSALTTNWEQMTKKTLANGTVDATGNYGPYLQKAPVNAFMNSTTVAAEAAAGVGWVWDADDHTIKAVIKAADAAKLSITSDENFVVLAAEEEDEG